MSMLGTVLFRTLGLLLGLVGLGLSIASLLDKRLVAGLARSRSEQERALRNAVVLRQPLTGLSVSGLKIFEAEELLDWLETQGCRQLEVTYLPDGVTVRCR
jgi:hypothetical protein